jgi:hypothetical protein
MRILSSSFVIALLAVLSQPGLSAVRPSFTADSEAWISTDIVLVSTAATDSTFEVNEVWKGSLRPGARVVVPQLVPSVDALPVSRYPIDLPQDPASISVAEQIPRQPTGSRLILFLKRNLSNLQEAEWEPANLMHSMKASVVWIEGDQLCWFTQVFNPGASILQCRGSYSLQKLKERVAEVSRTQEQMQSVLEIPEPGKRAQLLKPYLHSDVFDARRLAFEELGKSGPAAVPIIRDMLDDPAYTAQVPELIEAMVKAGGAEVGTDLHHRFEREVTFWESTGPSLQQGWWNKDPKPNAPLRLQYSQTFQLVIGLEKTRNKDALAPAKRLYDLWISLPQLNDPSGLNQMSLECEQLIRMLQSN